MTRSEDAPAHPQERLNAGERLGAALDEQRRLTERYDAARGTSGEMEAYAHLREAGEQVAARDAWIRSLDGSDPGPQS